MQRQTTSQTPFVHICYEVAEKKKDAQDSRWHSTAKKMATPVARSLPGANPAIASYSVVKIASPNECSLCRAF
jgi:hypothetical protein